MTRSALRLCYYKSLSTRDSALLGIKDQVDGVCQLVASAARTWWNSPSILDPSPLDAIAQQQSYELERNFLKVSGLACPPIRPSSPLPGHVRIEYYSDSMVTRRVAEGRWDCWADVPMGPKGTLDLKEIHDAFHVDPDHLTILSPVRWKPFPLDKTRPLTYLELHNLTYGGQLPLKVLEQDLPSVTHFTRALRSHILTLHTMFTALISLFFYFQAFDEYAFAVPLPWWFLWIYNLLRTIHPATRRTEPEEHAGPDFDVLASPVGGQRLEILSDPEERNEQERFMGVFSGSTSRQVESLYRIVGFAAAWMCAAEMVSCVRAASA